MRHLPEAASAFLDDSVPASSSPRIDAYDLHGRKLRTRPDESFRSRQAEATTEQTRYQHRELKGRKEFVVVTVQLAPKQPSAKHVSGGQAWREDYPWLHKALREVGPGAKGASDAWRVRIEDELKTTLEFRVRADGTAAVWCGMSGYDFHHDPTPKELFQGLTDAYRRERKRVGGSDSWKMSVSALLAPPQAPMPQRPVRVWPPAEDSLIRVLGAVLLPRAEQLMVTFYALTILTLALSTVAILAVR